MSQITRCPACSTQFKVVADQLRISEGWVRCGNCAEVFDASEFLMPAPPPALLPDVSLTDVRPPPQPVARADESTRAWGAPPASAPVAAKGAAVAKPQAPAVVAPSAPASSPARAQAPLPEVLAVPDPVLPAFLAAAPAGDRDGHPQGTELGLEPLAPFAWGGAPAAPTPRSPPQVSTSVPTPVSVRPVLVERQESRILSADMLELVLQGTRAPVPVAAPEAPAAQVAQAPVPLPGGYELPYAEDFADTALLPEGLSEDLELPQGLAVPAPADGAAAAAPQATPESDSQVHAPYPPLDLPTRPQDPPAQQAVRVSALEAAQSQPAERLERLEGDAGNAGRAKKQPLETSVLGDGRDVVDDVDGEVAPALALPSVAFPSVSTDSERKESPAFSSAPAELLADAAGDDGDDATADAAPTEDVSFVKAARRRAFWRKPLVRVALVAVSLGLLAVLAGQVAVHERNRLAAMEPRLRPALLALCEPLQCALAPQRQISDVVIDSSSFNKARGDSYVLAITMKSRATLPLEMPAVELTLTDAQDQPVLRRVLLPSEMSAPQELPAGGEWNAAVSVLVTTGGARVAGYRLLAFYP
ncbi:putative Zn finger-like uncharacterized protein [Acidovorax sp. 62]|uniref:zinc-ribbon and DUF3426 domain-containing protein n=1 Tax=Acidovorax sp. 62 TaxID=2035203 RepID=UPI000C19C766|nr:zinc-ribbon and DUF3426 domain-containing protein [Acidovorax sp. 62]PIF91654.1 putative Zn finger-like uncharacterized protein [Acidovorax sp. 62]